MIVDQIKSSLAAAVAAGAEVIARYPLPILTIVIFSILALNFISVLRTRYFHLNTIPGPRFAAFTRLWLCKIIASGDSAKKFVDINKEFGTLTSNTSPFIYSAKQLLQVQSLG